MSLCPTFSLHLHTNTHWTWYTVLFLLISEFVERLHVDAHFDLENCHWSFINIKVHASDWVCFSKTTLIFYWRTHWDASRPLTAPGSNNQYWPCDTGAAGLTLLLPRKHYFLPPQRQTEAPSLTGTYQRQVHFNVLATLFTF